VTAWDCDAVSNPRVRYRTRDHVHLRRRRRSRAESVWQRHVCDMYLWHRRTADAPGARGIEENNGVPIRLHREAKGW